MKTIETIKQECRTTIALAEAATPGEWRVDPTSRDDQSLLIRGNTEDAKWRRSTQLDAQDAAHIANARNVTAPMARALLAAIAQCEDRANSCDSYVKACAEVDLMAILEAWQ